MYPSLEADANPRILIIDDEPFNATGLARIVEKASYAVCITMTDPQLAVDRMTSIAPDIILLDLHMERLSGVEVLRSLNAQFPAQDRPPVLVLTADTTAEAKHEALQAGATDFLSKPFDHQEVTLRIAHLLENRALLQRCRVYSESLEEMVQTRTEELQGRTHQLEMALQDLQQTQQQIIRQERIRALETMAGGLAHDMTDSLSMILGYGDQLLQNTVKFPVRSLENKVLQRLIRAAGDHTQLVKRLHEFCRPLDAHENREPIDLNTLIPDVVAFTAPRWQAEAEGKSAHIDIDFQAGQISRVEGSAAELGEVIGSLIFNAVEAMPRGGQIRLATQETDGRVRVEISDSGMGMADEAVKQCFEPFYSTKQDKGAGLGLSVSHGIIRRHGGTISIESQPNRGTTVSFELPVARVTPPVERKPARTERALHVLVVDDQRGIRETVSAYLMADHHTVKTAGDAVEAMEKFRNEDFDLVITDRAMPKISGNDLAASIKELKPQEPVIMLTAFADMMERNGDYDENVDCVLGKPASRDELRQAICEVVGV